MPERPRSPDLDPLSRTQILIAMGMTAVLLLLAAKLWIQWGNVSIIPFRWDRTSLSLGVALGVGTAALSAVIYGLWPRYRHSADAYLHLILVPLAWPDLLWLGLLPGMSEELLFRGVMFPALGLTWMGLAVSSLCFGLLHLNRLQHWPYVLWATVIGAGFGWAMWRTDNLLVPVVAHAVANWVSSVVWKSTHRPPPQPRSRRSPSPGEGE
jgi:membrane protease YdiL (CAAX protease family)